jgi:ectoine hydroxylase-related dioxygenase (phytanoyl-CoA dioxygenase family)
LTTRDELLSTAPRVLTQEQRTFYFDTGYLKLEKFVSPDWLKRLLAATAEVSEQGRRITASNDVFYVEKGHSPENPRLQRLTTPDIRHETYWAFASESNIPDVVTDVVGPDVKFHHSKLNFKWAEGGQSFDWHQDIIGWPHTNYSPVTIGVYLDDCYLEQGPLAVIRKSHDGPLITEYNDAGVWTNAIASRHITWTEDEVDYLTGPAGTVFLLNCRTIHGSAQNNSKNCRRLLLMTYSSADAFAYTFNPHQTVHSGMIVRGKPALWASHDPRPCMVPPDWSKGFEGPFASQKKSSDPGIAERKQM